MWFFQNIRWRPEIGDPSVMGWITVAAYALAAWLAWLAGRRAGRAGPGDEGGRAAWWLVCALLLLLCVNKQLDVQSLFTDIGRVIAWKQGWYQNRREFQKIFVIVVIAVAGSASLVFFILHRRFWLRHPLLAAGLAFLLTFIVVRAVSFHHVDAFLQSRIGTVKFNWLFELTGIGLISIAAWLAYQNPAGRARKRITPRFIRH